MAAHAGQIDLAPGRTGVAAGLGRIAGPVGRLGLIAANLRRIVTARLVLVVSAYEPSEIVDLDENPSGVPMDDTPDGQGDATMDGQIDGQTDGHGGV